MYQGQNGHQDASLLERAREEGSFFWSEVVEIRSELQELAVKEVELLGAELQEQIRHATRGAIFGGVTAVIGFVFLIFLALSLMFGLAEVFQLWAAALITTGVIAAILGIVAVIAMLHIRAFSVTPKRTIQSLKEDAEWARNLLRSSRTSATNASPSPRN
ncbi:MAG TPA: phage holin family protein [Dehalococcoidia bacterium]|nr:phage holin family protein [Dehalococcoidia bacterium]